MIQPGDLVYIRREMQGNFLNNPGDGIFVVLKQIRESSLGSFCFDLYGEYSVWAIFSLDTRRTFNTYTSNLVKVS